MRHVLGWTGGHNCPIITTAAVAATAATVATAPVVVVVAATMNPVFGFFFLQVIVLPKKSEYVAQCGGGS